MKYTLLALFTVIIITLLFLVQPSDAQSDCPSCTDEHCIKLDEGGTYVTWSLPPESSSYFRKVVVKAGSDNQDGGACYSYSQDGSDGCYAVSGIGTKTVVIQKVGAGPACKDISHWLAYWWADHLGTLTPTPTAEPTSTPTPTSTQPPDQSPTPTSTPSGDETPTPTEPVITLTTPPLPSPTPTSTPETLTPTPPPNTKVGTMRGYLFCTYSDGTIGQGRGPLAITTDNRGVLGGIPFPNGYVGSWLTAPDSGTTVLRAGPGDCYRGGDAYPEDLTLYGLDAQPIFGVGNVGNSAVVCFEDCIDTSTFYLPDSGSDFANWFVNLVLRFTSRRSLSR